MFEMTDVPCPDCGNPQSYLAGERLRRNDDRTALVIHIYHCLKCNRIFNMSEGTIEYVVPEVESIRTCED